MLVIIAGNHKILVEPHCSLCVVSLSKALYPLLSTAKPRKTRPGMTEKILTGMQRIKSNKDACKKGKQGRPRSDCFLRSSLIWVCPVCLGFLWQATSVQNFITFTIFYTSTLVLH